MGTRGVWIAGGGGGGNVGGARAISPSFPGVWVEKRSPIILTIYSSIIVSSKSTVIKKSLETDVKLNVLLAIRTGVLFKVIRTKKQFLLCSGLEIVGTKRCSQPIFTTHCG